MGSTKTTTTRRCPTCGNEYSADTLVCSSCHTILEKHSDRPRTPVWVIILLLAIILALLGYIIFLSRETMIFHRF
ncbi:MAG TPA: DUF2116 family Zn-ribbon domain-containing protein [Armatimonadota bacterium]|nr:DUF2116 family Zn-ribbon domain-containing protein [Armatimonadota bacterium]